MTLKLTEQEMKDALVGMQKRKKMPFDKTEKWRLAVGLNTRIVGPLLTGRSGMELVTKMGGKRKPRKKG